jgi:hypothetical protein
VSTYGIKESAMPDLTPTLRWFVEDLLDSGAEDAASQALLFALC